MNGKILEEVKSPFTDELIQNLIEKFIDCGCDDGLFYKIINNSEVSDVYNNEFTTQLTREIFNTGVDSSSFYSEEANPLYYYRYNDSWVTISSESPNKSAFYQKKKTKDGKIPLMYRFYLNLKGKDKYDFVLNYINRCKEDNLPYMLKFSTEEGRNDQVVISSTLENFGANLSIIEGLTEGVKLNEIPMLIGEYKDGIGIAEEFFDRLYSPTQVKLALLRTSVKKYLCDHKDEFYEILSEDEKKEIDGYMYYFEIMHNEIVEDKEYYGEDYEDDRKKYYQIKSSLECAEEHIDNVSEAYCSGDGLLKLGNAIKKIYEDNKEKFISEVMQNYKMIGTQVWGFSEDFVFSNETKEQLAKSPDVKVELSAKQIGSELEVISREGIVSETQADLIGMAIENDKKIGIEN